MYSYIFITHGNMGREILGTAQKIMEEEIDGRHSIFSIDFSMAKELDVIKSEIKSCLDGYLKNGHKVIIFVDLFGGSPSNVAYTIAKHENVDVVSGINLPMIMYSIEHMESSKNLYEMVEGIMKSGTQNITSAKKLLNKKVAK
jgi:PTS system mannose-specific IIA component